MKIIVTTTKSTLTNHAGLFQIGQFFKSSGFRRAIDHVSKVKPRKGVPSDRDIIYCMIALYALGKTTYEAIEEYRYDRYFKQVLGIGLVPSAETLRQRLEVLPESVTAVLREWNCAIIESGFSAVNEQSTTREQWSESVRIADQWYMRIDSDVAVLDNSHTKKEGVNWTYKKCDGYAPMFSYIGVSGYMLNNELREGSMHTNCEGTDAYFKETITLGKQISPHPLLMVLDSGNDDKELLGLFEKKDVHYVVKRNLRRESRADWLTYAKEHAQHVRQSRDGGEVYYASLVRTLETENGVIDVRMVVVGHERLNDEHGQMLLEPEIRVEAYWTSLDAEELEVESVYHQRGTSEQYHAELKSDLGVERLPSGKFHANMLHLLLSMLAFNMLRHVGTQLLVSKKVPGKRGRRLRLRTVLQSVMYLAGQIALHSGQMFLRVCEHNAWTPAFLATL